jgi:hypothetical protein
MYCTLPHPRTSPAGLAANSFIQKREAPRYRSAFAGNITPWRLNVKLSKEILAHNTPASYRCGVALGCCICWSFAPVQHGAVEKDV